MKNRSQWKPTKYIYRKGKLKANRDSKVVPITSRVMADRIAKFYGDQIQKHVSGRTLDLGCGNAPLYIVYKAYASEITCVDWENTGHKNSFLDVVHDLNKPLPFGENEFDSIILSDVLEHIRYPENLIKEIFRILATNGKLLMNVPFYYNLHEQPYDYFRYTEHALKHMFENAGFKILILKSLGGVPEILADIMSKNMKRIPLIGKSLARFTVASNELFLKMSIGAKLSSVSNKTFPYAYALVVVKLND